MQLMHVILVDPISKVETEALVHVPTITCYEKDVDGKLKIHLMSGEILNTKMEYEEFVAKLRMPSSIVTPMR